MKTSKRTVLFILLFISLCAGISAAVFFTHFQVFYKPFQIISKRHVELNKQGICAKEGRRLSRQELTARAMASYFRKTQDWIIEDVGNGKLYRACRDNEGQPCYVVQLPPMSRMGLYQAYINTPEQSETEGHKSMRSEWRKRIGLNAIANQWERHPPTFPLPYSLYLWSGTVGDEFIPQDCCSVLALEDLPSPATAESETKYLFERGYGRYKLRFKFLLSDQIDLEEANLITHYIDIDNCGELVRKYFLDNEGNGIDRVNWTSQRGRYNDDSINFRISKQEHIPENCFPWKGDEPHEKSLDKGYKNEHPKTQEPLVFWDGRFLYTCPKQTNLDLQY